ncbi:MAG: sigma-70 family RNA polymerase sigma factor [Clostridia bacterium]|nr:sigma-70 family RNA polymerase sigma factor [Clostridia bacterium]
MSKVSAVSLALLEDEQLVLLAREGDEEAFVFLVTRCMPMLQRLAGEYRSSQFDCDDLVQEGLLALLSAVRSYRSEKAVAFRTYAYTCVRNRMISSLRQSGTMANDLLVKEDEPYVPAENDQSDPAVMLLRREALEDLRQKLRSLLTPLEYRVLMLYVGAFSYQEIAARLRISVKAVDNALQRLRRKLANSTVF